MLKIYFCFRLFEPGDRHHTSFEKEMIAEISSVLEEIRVQRKRKNEDVTVAQKVYCILWRIYSLGLPKLNLANLHLSTSSALERSFPQGPFQMSCHVIEDWHRFEMSTDPGFPLSLSLTKLKLDHSYVLLYNVL